tara:strand:+ start:125 stop:535 length:411 start_codon:yes stop_codon:yes gene_type:complete
MNKEKEIEAIIESIYGLVLEAKKENDILEKLEVADAHRISHQELDGLNSKVMDARSSAQKSKEKSPNWSNLDFKNNQSSEVKKFTKENNLDLKQLHIKIEFIFKTTVKKYIRKKVRGMIERQFSNYSKQMLKDKLK